MIADKLAAALRKARKAILVANAVVPGDRTGARVTLAMATNSIDEALAEYKAHKKSP